MKLNQKDPTYLMVCLTLAFAAVGLVLNCNEKEGSVLIPVIEGEWWTVAHNPELHQYGAEEQETTSYGLWQAADGAWQLWGCIRNTAIGGNTRLFYRWEGSHITDTDWAPKGIVMTAEPKFGDTPGGLQAPFAARIGNGYVMVHGNWEHICLARSPDGKTFARQLNPENQAGLFHEGLGNGSRDPMIMVVDSIYHVYYTANPDGKGAIYCRTSKDLHDWSDSRIVSTGGRAGSDWYDAEVPVVIYHPSEKCYYLFRTHSSKDSEQFMTSVYRSPDPFDFGIDHDRFRITSLPVEAARIVVEGDQYYIAGVRSDHQGYHIARLGWILK